MTDSVGEKGSRLLDEAAHLCDMLRMAHSTAHRMQMELHGKSYDRISEIGAQLHDLRVVCNSLFDDVANEVEEMDSGEQDSGNPSDTQK
ncbi:hypothetical protein [Thiohalophilus thiocyanatoxydans]|uniref:Uncharacterized protein n=1 Tax=Thiohalophilus thiocyanatoxydans TaxID=381308 RepID=A0A4R8ITK2_9GAMM|nr:hypothetical protein [Thiohalophilus thiocyanatoxydans]TDY03744.1 hypothetical protein EDC23_0113 [Thiohalophilus thiocyanatoxydans]